MGPQKDSLFRSAEMSLTQLYISNEIGREVISSLGEIGELQFRDVSIKSMSLRRSSGTNEERQQEAVRIRSEYLGAWGFWTSKY